MNSVPSLLVKALVLLFHCNIEQSIVHVSAVIPTAADLRGKFVKQRNLGFGVLEKVSKCKVQSEGLFSLWRTNHSRRKLDLAMHDKCMKASLIEMRMVSLSDAWKVAENKRTKHQALKLSAK